MPKYEYTVSLYTESGVIEADDEDDARVRAEEYVRNQFSDALGQADWWFSQVADDAQADNS